MSQRISEAGHNWKLLIVSSMFIVLLNTFRLFMSIFNCKFIRTYIYIFFLNVISKNKMLPNVQLILFYLCLHIHMSVWIWKLEVGLLLLGVFYKMWQSLLVAMWECKSSVPKPCREMCSGGSMLAF